MNIENSGWERSALSYCSNLHPGESLEEVTENIRDWFVAVRKARELDSMSSGLWLSARAVDELQSPDKLSEFNRLLLESGLHLSTLNGFPYGNFHADVVKTEVYSPNWSERARVEYTERLVDILSHCLPSHQTFGSISTLPVGYKSDMTDAQIKSSVDNMIHMEHYLSASHQETGRKVLLCLEMEPDCVLEKTSELLSFFEKLKAKLGHPPQYLGTCYDICHQGVMYEDIHDSLSQITVAGISIGKIQVSNAIEVNLSKSTHSDEVKSVLAPFSQDKFLHQVKALDTQNAGELMSCSDLIDALIESQDDSMSGGSLLKQWDSARIHFHIPLHAEAFISPIIRPLHRELNATFAFLAEHQTVRPHLEIETYTWQVLPKELQPESDAELVTGIAKEFDWLEKALLKNNLLVDDPSSAIMSGRKAV